MGTDINLLDRIAELEVSQRRAEIIAQVNADLSRATDEQAILSALGRMAEYSGAAVAALAYAETDAANNVTGAKVVALQLGGNPVAVTDVLPTDDYPLESNPILQIALDHPDEPLFVENIFTDPRTEAGTTRDAFKHSGMTATVILWFKANNRWQGVMTFSWPTEMPFNEDVRAISREVQPVAAAVIANRRLMLSLETSAGERGREADLFKKLVENSVDAIYITSMDSGEIVYANPATYQMFGYDVACGELVGMLWTRLCIEDQVEAMLRDLAPIIEKGSWSGEIENVRKDGTVIISSATSFPILNDDGKMVQAVTVARDITAQKQIEAERATLQEQVIEAQRQALAELSTPIIPIVDRIIVMPLVGSIDTVRSRDIMRALLEGITRYRAQIAILDITGVPIVDSGVADHLNRTMQAARLKGTQTIITGISDAVAETIVDLGVDWSAFETVRDLQSGLIMALERLGLRLVTNAHLNGNGKKQV